MSNLYEDLDIPKDASADEIRKAYKILAQINHPDKGGDNLIFKKINHAYRILKNSESKKRYDEFGDESKPINQKQAAKAELAKLFQQIIRANITNLKHKHVVNAVKDNIVAGIINTNQKIKEVNNNINYLNDAIGRVSPNDSILAAVFEDEIKVVKNNLVQLKNMKEMLMLMKEEINNYKYKVDETVPETPSAIRNTFTYITTGP